MTVIRGIKIEDQQLGESFTERSKYECFGGVELTSAQECALSLPPGFCTFSTVQRRECLLEIEACLAKIRWERNGNSSDRRSRRLTLNGDTGRPVSSARTNATASQNAHTPSDLDHPFPLPNTPRLSSTGNSVSVLDDSVFSREADPSSQLDLPSALPPSEERICPYDPATNTVDLRSR